MEDDRENLEAALRSSEQRFSLIFDQALDGTAIVALDSRFERVNPVFARMTGYEPDELVGRHFSEITHPDDSARDMAEISRVLAGDLECYETDKRYVHKDGSIVWGHVKVQLVRDADGRPLYFIVVIRDISERVRIESELRESEDKFRVLWTHSQVPASITRPTGYIEVNDAFCRMLGYTHEELTEQSTWMKLTHPDDIAEAQRHVDALLAGERASSRFEKRYLHKDGRVVWTDLMTSLRRDAAGKPLYFMTTILDISERKRAEKTLLESEQRFRTMFDLSPDPCVIVNMSDATIIEVNERFCEQLGYTPKEATGKTPVELGLFVDVRVRDRLFAQAQATGSYANEVVEYRAKSGARFTALASARVVSLNGEPHMYTTAHDITERTVAEEALRASERRLSSVIETISLLGVILDTKGSITLINDYLLALTGWKRKEVLGRNWFELFLPPQIRGEIEDGMFLKTITVGKTPAHYENEIVTRQGERRLVSWNNTVLRDASGDVEAVASIGEDITERKQAEEEIKRLNTDLERRVAKRTTELEGAVKELEAFSYSVSHDLRAPLRAMDGFSQILLEDYGDKLDDDARHNLDRIRQGARKMATLINGLLELSRLNRSEIDRRPLDLTALALGITRDLRLGQPDREVAIVVADGLKASVDRDLARVLLANLLDNAWKFTGKHEHAHIEVGAAVVSGETAFFVRDDGAGFDMAYAVKLFGAFQRMHSPDEFEGTGIGLATVQRIVHRHGGCVWAEAEVEKGATFFFTLPE